MHPNDFLSREGLTLEIKDFFQDSKFYQKAIKQLNKKETERSFTLQVETSSGAATFSYEIYKDTKKGITLLDICLFTENCGRDYLGVYRKILNKENEVIKICDEEVWSYGNWIKIR